MSREINWGNEETVSGAPRPFHEHELALRRAAEEIRKQPYMPFGPTEEQRQRLDEELKALVERAKPARGASLRMKVIPEGKSIQFTPQELYRAATDPKFAAEIFIDATGIEDPNRQDIQEFQSRIYEKHPSVIQAGEEGRLQHIPEEEIRERLPKLPSERLEYPNRELEPIPEGIPGQEPPRGLMNRPNIPGHPEGVSHDYASTHYRVANLAKEVQEGRRPIAELRDEINRTGMHHLVPFVQDLENYQRQEAERPQREQDYERQIKEWQNLQRKPEIERKHQELREEKRAYEQERERLAEAENTPEAQQAREAEKRRVFDQLQREYSENLKGRTKLPQEEAALRQKYATVAPMNETHDEAARRLRAQVGSHEPAMRDIGRAINESNEQNISDVTRPHINEAMRHPGDFVDQYKNQYENDVIANMKKEMEENFLEKVLPSINARVSPMSGARHALLQHYAENMQKDLNRKIAEMRHQNFSEAMKHGQQHRGIMLETGKATGQAAQMQHENKIREAEALRNREVTGRAMGQSDVQALSQLAQQKQQQAQNEINERRAEQARKEAHGKEQVRFGTEIAHKLPASQTVTHHLATQPPPQAPSALQAGAGMMPHLYQMMSGQQLPQSKMASGGQVVNPEIAAHEATIQEMENKMRNAPHDYWGDVLHSSGAKILQNMGGNMGAMGQGMEQAHHNRLAHQQHQTGLYEKIMNSRLARKEAIEAHERHKETRDETKRHHTSMEALRREELENKEQAPRKLGSADQKLLNTAEMNLQGVEEAEPILAQMEILAGKLDTGGVLPSMGVENAYALSTPIIGGVGSQKDINNFQTLAGDLVTMATKSFGAKAGIQMQKALEQYKPSMRLDKQANLDNIHKLKEKYHKIAEKYGHIVKRHSEGATPFEALAEHRESKQASAATAASPDKMAKIAALQAQLAQR